MKKLVHLLSVFFVISFSANAQNVNYKIIKDNPDEIQKLFIYLNVADFDATSFKEEELETSMNLGVALEAKYLMSDKLSFDSKFNFKYLPLKGDNMGFDFELGGQFNFISKYKTPESTNINLGRIESYDEVETTYVAIPNAGKTKIHYSARDGLIFNQLPTTYNNPNTSKSESVMVNTFGVYAGVSTENWRNLLVELLDLEKRNKRNTSVYFNFYGDLIFGSSTISNIENTDILGGGVGYRVGADLIRSMAKGSETFNMKGRKGISSLRRVRLELGSMPATGFYLKATLAIRLASPM